MSDEEADPIKSTKAYKSWKSIVISARKFPIVEYSEELDALHDKRPARDLTGGRVSAQKLLQVHAMEVHTRSRAVELWRQGTNVVNDLHTGNKALRSYLVSEGLVHGRTISDKTHAMDLIMDRGIRVEADIKGFLEETDKLIEDVDKAAWSLKQMLECIQVMSKPEANL